MFSILKSSNSSDEGPREMIQKIQNGNLEILGVQAQQSLLFEEGETVNCHTLLSLTVQYIAPQFEIDTRAAAEG